jgi:hypothetical protein
MGVVFDRVKRLAKRLVKKRTPQEKLDDNLGFYAANSSSPERAGDSGKEYFEHFLKAIDAGANPNYFDGDNSILLWAVSHSGIKAAVWLCEHAKEYGIDLDKKSNWHDYNDITPLILAAKKGWDHTPTSAEETEKRAKKFSDSSAFFPGEHLDRQGQIIKALLENGADPNLQDWKGNTALHIALLKREIPTIEILLRHGARLDIKNGEGLLPEDMLKTPYRGIDQFLLDECGDEGLCVYVHTLQRHDSWEKALAPIQKMLQKHRLAHPLEPIIEQETTHWRQGKTGRSSGPSLSP